MFFCGKFADSAQRKKRSVSLNKFTERYNILLISLPKIVVGEVLRFVGQKSQMNENSADFFLACTE